MIRYIIFSKNRASQLDLLLRSIDKFCSGVQVDVLYCWSNEEFKNGYEILFKKQYRCLGNMYVENSFRNQTIQLIENSTEEFVGFLTDDSIFFNPLNAHDIIEEMRLENIKTFSPRNGLNTKYANYWTDQVLEPLQLKYSTDKFIVWDFTTRCYGTGYGRPVSLDGNFHDRQTLLKAVLNERWNNPRELDGISVAYFKPYMMSYHNSVLVNISVNLVFGGYADNWGKRYICSVETLNDRFLNNRPIKIDGVLNQIKPIATHTEVELEC